MELCGSKCAPSCDYCKWSRHGDFERDGTTFPIGCRKYKDEEHQMIAKRNKSCSDFSCLRVRELESEN